MVNMSKDRNITKFHPIMENYEQYQNITRYPFDESKKFQFGGLIAEGFETFINGLQITEHLTDLFLAFPSCLKPCIDVHYTASVDTFFLTSKEIEEATGGLCSEDSGIIHIQYSRVVEYEVVSQLLTKYFMFYVSSLF